MSSGASRFVITLAACIAGVLVVGVFTVRHIALDLPGEIVRRYTQDTISQAREIADRVAGALHARPRVIVTDQVIVEQDAEVAKLVTLERSVTARHRVAQTWLGSEKTFEVEGDFVIRAGFDFERPFVVEMNATGDAITVTLPPAHVLSTELVSLRILEDEDGFWNKLTGEDRESAIRELKLRAMAGAAREDLPALARAAAEQKLTRLLTRENRAITFATPAPKP